MEILTFDKNSNILTEKYAPTNIKQIIGSKRQVIALVDWLDNFNKNASIHAKSIEDKKGKKQRKRKAKTTNKKNDDEHNEGLTDGLTEGLTEGLEDQTNDELAEDAETQSEMFDNKGKKKDPNMYSCAVVTGDHGTGKTAVVKAVLWSLGYKIRSVNFAKLVNIRSIDDFAENLLKGYDIYDTIGNKNDKFAILVDDVQSVSTPSEKNVIDGILQTNSERWYVPVIFIGSNKHKKPLTMIKKECYHISMYPPSTDDMLELLERIGLGEEMRMENEDVVAKIIKHSQNDFRRLIVIMSELLRQYKSNTISKIDIDKYFKYTEQKDIDRTIYENTWRLFSNYNGINSALKIFETDKLNMPLMVHQNHFKATTKYIKNKNDLLDLATQLTENIAHGDVIDNYIYSDQFWSLQEAHGFYTCVNSSYKLSKTIDTAKLEYDANNPYYRPVFSPDYPKDLNRTSTRCINYKNVKLANEYFKDMTIDDYVMAIKLIKSLLEDGRIEECSKLLKEYNLTSQGIMYVLKIDKINGTRKDVSKSIEKKIKEIAIEPIKSAVIKTGSNMKSFKNTTSKQSKLSK